MWQREEWKCVVPFRFFFHCPCSFTRYFLLLPLRFREACILKAHGKSGDWISQKYLSLRKSLYQGLKAFVCWSFSPPAAEYALALYASLDSFLGLFVAPPLEDCLTGLTGSSTRAETGCTDLHLIGSSVATARHRPDLTTYCYIVMPWYYSMQYRSCKILPTLRIFALYHTRNRLPVRYLHVKTKDVTTLYYEDVNMLMIS